MFGVIKNVMSTTVPEKKNDHKKLSQAHNAKVNVTFLKEPNIQVLARSAFSPDLAPYEVWLFLLIKEKMAGRKSSLIQDLAKAVKSKFRSPCIASIHYQNAFESWRRRRTVHAKWKRVL